MFAEVLPQDVTAKSSYSERPMQFGSDSHLFGVLTTPNNEAAAPYALIILNAGVLHRVGPHRLHVNLARRASALGVPALRLDLSGIGDSESPRTTLDFRELSVRDVQSAMDAVTRATGIERFMLFGICSGADNSLACALNDSRVFSIAVADSICYISPQARLRKVAIRFSELGGVRQTARWGLGKLVGLLERYASAEAQPEGAPEVATQQGRELPDKDDYERQLQTLVSKGTTMLAIFSGAMGERYNGPEQLFEVFPSLRGKITCHYFPNANHTFTELSSQRELLDVMSHWVKTKRPPVVKQLHA